MIKFIATDMDGTLLNDQGHIQDQVFDLIQFLHDKNITFAAASGRFYSQLEKNFKNVKTPMIFIAHNGALIKYNHDKERIYTNHIDKKQIQCVIKNRPNLGEEVFLAGENKAYVVEPSKILLDMFDFYGVDVVKLKSFSEVKTDIYKITYYVHEGVENEMILSLKNTLHKDLEYVVSGDRFIDIMNKGISKGNAIKILQKRFGIDPEDTMVFGDYYNDLSMFKVAHYSYAMENAPSDVKENAKFITKSNNDNGVYQAICEHVAV